MNFGRIEKVLEFPGLGRDGETTIPEKAGGRLKWCTFLKHNLTIYTNILKLFCLATHKRKVFLRKLETFKHFMYNEIHHNVIYKARRIHNLDVSKINLINKLYLQIKYYCSSVKIYIEEYLKL